MTAVEGEHWLNDYSNERFLKYHEQLYRKTRRSQSCNGKTTIIDSRFHIYHELLKNKVPLVDFKNDVIHPMTQDIEFPQDWTKDELLGSGGFGDVYLYHDQNSQFKYAVKQIRVPPQSLFESNTDLTREIAAFNNELENLKKAQHEHVVQYFGSVRQENAFCIVMEYMAGGSVKDQLRLSGSLSENITKHYCRQIISGLEYIHSQNILHRDIKCANVLRDLEIPISNVKLADFGCSKHLQSIVSASGVSKVVGTPYWISPEIVKTSRCTRRSDVWSLGCTLVEMLTGKPPLSHLEPYPAMFKITHEDINPDFPDTVSDSCRYFIKQLLTRNYNDRPSTFVLRYFDFIRF